MGGQNPHCNVNNTANKWDLMINFGQVVYILEKTDGFLNKQDKGKRGKYG